LSFAPFAPHHRTWRQCKIRCYCNPRHKE
jgi:hypothetical protein